MTAETSVKELTVSQYEFYKSGRMPDKQIMKIHGLDHNQLHKWKKERDLVGKDYGLRGGPSIKTYKASEVKPLKENDIPPARLAETYDPNKKLSQKLAESGWDRVKEMTADVSEEMKSEIQALAVEKLPPSIEEKQTGPSVSDSLEAEIAELRKEKAWLEERHGQDTEEKVLLRAEVEKAGRQADLILQVSEDVKAERFRQNRLYGLQRHAHGKWLIILMEEVGEVAQAMQRGEGWGKETDADDLYKELTHVSAVSNALAEQVLEERKGVKLHG